MDKTAVDPLAKWKMQAVQHIPGTGSTWDKMKVLDKTTSKSEAAPTMNPFINRQALVDSANPFIHTVHGVPTREQLEQQRQAQEEAVKAAKKAKKTAAFGNIMKYFGKAARQARKLKADKAWKDLEQMAVPNGMPWRTLLNDTADGGRFNATTYALSSIVRPLAGYTAGDWAERQMYGAESSGMGGVAGAVAGLAGRRGLNMFGKGLQTVRPGSQLGQMLANKQVARRLLNDPAMRALTASYVGSYADQGLGLLGIDTNGAIGTTMGGLGLVGGAKPMLQIARTLSPRLNRIHNAVKARGGIGAKMMAGYDNVTRGGYNNLAGHVMASPVTSSMGTAAMVAPIAGQTLMSAYIDPRLDEMSALKKSITDITQSEGMSGISHQLDPLLKELYGPNAAMVSPLTGLPTAEAVELMRLMGTYGINMAQQAGTNYFRDPNYLLNPENYEKIMSPYGIAKEVAYARMPRFLTQRRQPQPYQPTPQQYTMQDYPAAY